MQNDQNILDALHIYNVVDVIDREKNSKLKILWTEDLHMAFLSINGYYQAVFDFQKRAGYIRTGFPDSRTPWTQVEERLLTDELVAKLAKV